MTYLKHAGALNNEKRGQWMITERGIQLLETKETVTLETLKQFPEFLEFQARTGTRKKQENIADNAQSNGATPEELIDVALAQILGDLEQDLLARLKAIDPYQFEEICKDLLCAMEYGGSSEELAYVTKKSGDGGIDAVIKQDPLGVQTIYVQAKRYTAGEVREKDIRDFLGALAQKSTQNGVFITTSTFSTDAMRAIQSASNMNIIPVDGNTIVKLMIEHQVGIRQVKQYTTYSIDSEYFGD